jgi:2,5-diketo-D-gluconate reductase A
MGTTTDCTLNNGVDIPRLGFGVFQIPPEDTAQAVGEALRSGYRLIDTAAGYGNEEGVGVAVADSGIARDDVFITTKLANADHGYDNALAAFDRSMSLLGVEVIDLYLIHWPLPAHDLFVETWRALEKLYAEGRTRAIGVSNFTTAQLRRLMNEADVVPAVNQIELHPYFPQRELRQFHVDHGIATEAWSPLGQGKTLLSEPTVTALAESLGRTPAQVVLRWHLQLDNIVIPKSVTPERIRQNLQALDFELGDAEMTVLNDLATEQRMGPDPDTFNDR